MSINILPPSPSGELLHGDIREKINELIERENGKQWKRVTSSTAATDRFARYDVFPSADDQVITLPDPSLGDYDIEVHNQTDNAAFDVIVNNFAGSQVLLIKAGEAYSFFKNDTATNGDIVELRGSSIPLLPVATYGNFNALTWDDVPSGIAVIKGNGSQFSNYPSQYVLDPTVPYDCVVQIVNTNDQFSQTITFSTAFVPSSTLPLGRPAVRSGGNLGAAITLGWQPYAKLTDIISIVENRIAIGNTVSDGSGNPNQAGVLTVNLLGNGGDELLTPPASPQPVTGGNYNGYQPIALELIEQSGALIFDSGSILVGAGGGGKYRSSHAWIDMSSSAQANNVGFVFGVERGGQLYFSARVTGDRLNQQNDRTNVSGGGFVELQEGDKLTLWGCSELASTVTIYDANLGLEMTLPEVLVSAM